MEKEARESPGSNTLLQDAPTARRTLSFVPKPGTGIISDVRARAPWYLSDWTDAWNYRVVPATALIFFANVLPGIAFSLDLIETTQQYTVTEVLISSFMAAFVFSVFGAQPLTIAGVTGPITVFNKTIYDIIHKQSNAPNYLHFVGWVYLWAAIIHWVTAIFNWCNAVRYVTLFSCDTFGFYVSWVYLQYGVQVITRQFSGDFEGALVGITLALLMLVTSFLFQCLSETTLFHRHIRRFFSDYGMPISLIAVSSMAYWGRFNASNPSTLPVGGAFQAANGRAWLVKFWELDGKWVGIALPFGIILWILFFFDHNVSSLIAQGSQFPLRKPPGFHYDFFLLGITTFIAGLIGVPAPNGLIPQAPIHTASLLIMGKSSQKDIDEEQQITKLSSESGNDSNGAVIKTENSFDYSVSRREVPIAVVEQRVSNLAQGSLCLVLLTGPFLHILGLVPRGVLAGLFWFMGANALKGNGITIKLLYLIRDKTLTSPNDPLKKVRKSRLLMFVAIQLVAFGATFVVTQSIAALGFPIIILLLVPLRTYVIPLLPFTQEELSILDGPTASPFTMESVGGSLHTA
ncbi:HCO3 transporter family-domain-containing protein [Suillus bovinus]|uniref:HCO3 transporter family-domain-containing protein n=1 Tax=Suillus bovinus TaxID=48563 RepID=UPI001B87FD8F|nr:HCO3 transporter family-domain-containing protein [Suillus bovinus]KAG2144190.1 HCO3 transporter family-domain-containing protein [Suillus bovinus]